MNDVKVAQSSALQATLSVPPDKAIAHRLVFLSAMAQGETEIWPWPTSDDCQRTLSLVEQLGISVRRSSQTVWIEGAKDQAFRPSSDELYCGESGTTLRLAAGLLAGQPLTSRLTAGHSLSRRPMHRLVEPLSRMGADVEGMKDERGSSEIYPPVVIRGRRPLKAIHYESPVASAQVKSAILLAGLFADGRTSVSETHPTRDHTEQALRRFGVLVDSQGTQVSVDPGPLRSPGRMVIPGDFSSAAFFIVAAVCIPGSRITLPDLGLNPTRIGLLRLLRRMGANIRYTLKEDLWEPRGTVVVESCPVRAISLEAHEVPGVIDELPILMVAAACARGTSRLEGLGELRVKETDRIQSMQRGLTQLGARVRLVGSETLEIEGGPLKGAVVESLGDHRTAMSLAVAGLIAKGTTQIRKAECVTKSFPDFFEKLRQISSSRPIRQKRYPGLTATQAVSEKSLTSPEPFVTMTKSYINPRMSKSFLSRLPQALQMLWNQFLGLFSNDLAIDLGTATTLVYVKGRGILLCEPSVVAIQRGSSQVLAVGEEAKRMIGRTPGNISAIRPMRDGVIADFDVTEAMLRYFIKKAQPRKLNKPLVVVAIPSGITEVEKRAVRDSALRAGAREVFLVEEPKAASIGVGLPIHEPGGNMIIDIGGGTTELAVISLDGIVIARSIRIAGDEMDQAIIEHLRKAYNLMIGERTAEEIKIRIGSAYPLEEEMTMDVRGRDLVTGLPKTVTVTSEEVREALAEPIRSIVEATRLTLEKTPPELSADLVDRGIVMAGGGSLLRGLDRLLAEETGLPVHVAENPVTAVAMGVGKGLDDIRYLRNRIAISTKPEL